MVTYRIADWQEVLGQVTERQPIEGGLRLSFPSEVPLGEVAALAAAEQGCCSFFSFALTVDGRGTALEVRAPAGAADLVTTLFGVPA